MANTNIKKITINDMAGNPLVLDLEDFSNTGNNPVNNTVNKNLFIYNKATTTNLTRTDYTYTQTDADTSQQIIVKVEAIYPDSKYLVDSDLASENKFSYTFTTTDLLYGINLGIHGSTIDSICTIKFDEPYSVNTTFTVSFVVTNITQGSVSFKDVKIELGDKATEWSVAPEEDFSTLYTSQYNSIIQTDKNLDDVNTSWNVSQNQTFKNFLQTSISGTQDEFGNIDDYTILKEITLTVPVSGYYKLSYKFTYNNSTSIGGTVASATQSGDVLKTVVKNPRLIVKQNDTDISTLSNEASYTKTISFTAVDGGNKHESTEGSLVDLNMDKNDIVYLHKGSVVLQVEAIIYQKVTLSVGQEGSVYSKLVFDYFYSIINATNQIILANDGIAITQAGGQYFKIYNSQNSTLNVQMNGLPTDSTNLQTGQLYSNKGTLMIKQ